MNILLTGAAGQLGQALRQQLPAGIELIATSRSGDPATGLLPLDLADAEACRAAVDKAEGEPELALAVNAGAPRAFAEALRETGGRLLQLSTDFVFICTHDAAAAQRARRQRPKPCCGGRSGGLPAVLHWSDAGAASWYDVAVAVGELGVELGLLKRMAPVNPITTADYPTPAKRPSGPATRCWIAPPAAGPWIYRPPTGTRRCGSCWRPWHEPNPWFRPAAGERAQPPPGC